MSDDTTGMTRSIRSLTVAVWSLCGAIVLLLAFLVWGYVASARQMKRLSEARGVAQVGKSTGTGGGLHDDEDLFDLPLDKKIAQASVILIAKYEPDNGRLKAVITEIIKKRPNVVFHYAVGEEYELLSSEASRGNGSPEDGQVAFFTGSPAALRGSYSYSKGRIGGLGDITLDQFRERVKSSK